MVSATDATSQHQPSGSPWLKLCANTETTSLKIYLRNCSQLNLECMHAALLSVRYSELLLWPYDKRMQEIITNLPPSPEQGINYREQKVRAIPINQCNPFRH